MIHNRVCIRCGNKYYARTAPAKYCMDCRADVYDEKQKLRRKKRLESVKILKSNLLK